MSRSEKLFTRAQRSIPGGVNSPVRAFKGVGGTPLFIQKSEGCTITDVDGNSYIDFVGSWGPMILGHNHPGIQSAIQKALANGTSFGAPTEGEVLLAEKIVEMVPSIENVRLVNSGTEATMSALRLARGFTKRSRIVKFAGCYHGHADHLLVQAGSGALTMGTPDSAGVPEAFAQLTTVLPFNDTKALTQCFESVGQEIAAVIVEPVAGNMGCVLPKDGFLQTLEKLCKQNKSVLIFDEVMTGFRLAPGGAQERFGMKPDLTCLGKIIGGGLPVGAYGGRKEIMDHISPKGPVYQAGTLSGNPLAVAAGLAALNALADGKAHQELEEKADGFYQSLQGVLAKSPLPLTLNHLGSMFCLYFHPGPVEDFAAVQNAETQTYAKFFHGLLKRGIYMAPSAFECAFLSLAHSSKDLSQACSAIQDTLNELAS